MGLERRRKDHTSDQSRVTKRVHKNKGLTSGSGCKDKQKVSCSGTTVLGDLSAMNAVKHPDEKHSTENPMPFCSPEPRFVNSNAESKSAKRRQAGASRAYSSRIL